MPLVNQNIMGHVKDGRSKLAIRLPLDEGSVATLTRVLALLHLRKRVMLTDILDTRHAHYCR